MTLSQAIAARAEASGMTPAQAIAYRLGALEARLIIRTAADNILRRTNPAPERTTQND